MGTKPDDLIHPITGDNGYGVMITTNGLTKRELFAAMAMQGLLANPNVIIAISSNHENTSREITISDNLSGKALFQADALITELNKETK